jgi:hypothetical protein
VRIADDATNSADSADSDGVESAEVAKRARRTVLLQCPSYHRMGGMGETFVRTFVSILRERRLEFGLKLGRQMLKHPAAEKPSALKALVWQG